MGVTIVKSRQARNTWREVLDKVLTGGDVVIERNGKAVAALIPIEDYQALLDELDDLRAARRAGAAYLAWQKEPATAIPWKEFKAQLEAEGLLNA